MCNSFSNVVFTLVACGILLVGCRGGGDIDCQSRDASWKERQYQLISEYAKTSVADAQVLGRGTG